MIEVVSLISRGDDIDDDVLCTLDLAALLERSVARDALVGPIFTNIPNCYKPNNVTKNTVFKIKTQKNLL